MAGTIANVVKVTISSPDYTGASGFVPSGYWHIRGYFADGGFWPLAFIDGRADKGSVALIAEILEPGVPAEFAQRQESP